VGSVGGDQVLSYARCPRTQEPIGFTEYGRCSVNARSLESTWSPPPTQEAMEKTAPSMRAIKNHLPLPPMGGGGGEKREKEKSADSLCARNARSRTPFVGRAQGITAQVHLKDESTMGIDQN